MMKFFHLLLLFWCSIPAFSVTLEIEIGRAKVGEQTARSVTLEAKSEDWQEWRIQASTPEIRHGKKRLPSPQIAGALIFRDNRLELRDWQLHTALAKSQFVLSADAIVIENLMGGNARWPSELSLHLREESGRLVVESRWQRQAGLHSQLHAELALSQLADWLSAAGMTGAEQLDGKLSPEITLSQNNGNWQIEGTLNVRQGHWQSPNQLQAIDGMDGVIRFTARQSGKGWSGHISGEVKQGEVLFTPLYFSYDQHPFSFRSDWRYQNDQLNLIDFQAEDGVVNLWADGQYSPGNSSVNALTVHQLSGSAAEIYPRYLQPFLINTVFGDGKWQGSVFFRGRWQAGKGVSDLVAVFNQVTIHDQQERYQFNRIDGQIGEDDGNHPSHLSMADSSYRKLPIGASTLDFSLKDNKISLRSPWRIPIFDGALVIEDLQPLSQKHYRLNAHIEPIDLHELALALDWPEFEGEISGEFPNVTLKNDGMALTQPVQVKVFDGELAMTDLRVDDLFSNTPILHFSVIAQGIDLGRLSTAFKVGKVEGRIGGRVDDMVFVNWQPVSFQADLHSVEGYPEPRIISHEAVQYLTRAGGSSAIIAQFIRLLNVFRYDKLGVKADLNGDVLTLDGVAPAENGGFYLVKGRGIPRLDVIGYEHRTSWSDLLARVKSAIASDGPVME